MQHFFGENLEERKNAKGLLAPSELGDPKPNELKVIKSDQITLPPIVKHVLAPQNEIGMPKTTWSNYKRSRIWVDPPPCSFKIPTFSRFLADVPNFLLFNQKRAKFTKCLSNW